MSSSINPPTTKVHEYPTLYTMTTVNGVRYWKISVIEGPASPVSPVSPVSVFIRREYGKYGGKAIINQKVVSEAKSQPTVYEQAVFEAHKDWEEMQKKKGYVTDQNRLTSTVSQLTSPNTQSHIGSIHGETTDDGLTSSISKKKVVIVPRLKFSDSPVNIQNKPMTVFPSVKNDLSNSFKFLPMLANKFNERKRYVKYPCIGQPKIDGIRHTARKISATEITIKTRNDEECLFFDEIKIALKTLNLDSNVCLDGEFYSRKIPFRTLNGYCNRKKLDGKTGYRNIPRQDLESIHYYLFDCYFIQDPQKSFEDRYAYLSGLMAKNISPYLHLVPNVIIGSEEEVSSFHDRFVSEGYEGLIVRNQLSPYKLKDRSNDLLKLKYFKDDEFLIVGAQTPDTGKEEGCIIWELKLMTSELIFTCRPRDSYESRKADWLAYQTNPNQFIGRHYTVRFQETYENGVPRFPVGIAIRWDL